jgi:ribosomal protein S24E
MSKMNVIKDFKNDLLKRREVQLVMTAEKNPGLAAAAKMIADHFKSSEDAIVVRKLSSKFGRDTFMIDAFIYGSAADRVAIEPKKRVKKKEGEAGGAK